MRFAARHYTWINPIVIVVAIAIAYADDLHGPFIFDDGRNIVESPNIRLVWPLTDSMSAMPNSELVGRPLVCLSLAINFYFGGLDPLGYHLVNIASHVACALLLYGVVRRTLLMPMWEGRWTSESAAWFAGSAALLWAAHPLLTDAVSYVTQRTETFMSMFLLLMLYSLTRTGWWWRLIAVIACAMGMACKENMVVAPLLAMLYGWMFLPRRSAPGIWLYGALLATALIIPLELQGANLESKSGYGLKYVWWFDYLKTQAGVIVHYLHLAFVPRGLVIDYFGWPIVHDLSLAVAPGLFILALLALTVAACVRRWWPGFLGAWFFLILAPTSSVLPNFTEIAAERRMYLPLAAVVVLMLAMLWQFVPRAAVRAAVVLVLIVTLTGLTIVRNWTYRSDIAIWTDAAEKRPENAHAHYFLARAYFEAGQWQQALGEDDESLRLAPRLVAPADLRPLILEHLDHPPR